MLQEGIEPSSHPYQGCVLPLDYKSLIYGAFGRSRTAFRFRTKEGFTCKVSKALLVGREGIEPSPNDYESFALPSVLTAQIGTPRRIRTFPTSLEDPCPLHR